MIWLVQLMEAEALNMMEVKALNMMEASYY
jgi:hypothetical protein